MPYDVPPELAGMSLAEIAQAVESRKLPPVATWNPQDSGESHMRIARDGRWYHDGGEITRPAMVRAFAGLLRRDGDGFWLVVPYQKLSIEVEDAPFVATDVRADREGGEQVLTFRINTDEFVTADAEHPVIARGSADEPAIYVVVREGLEARLDRSTWLQLAEIALAEDRTPPAVSSKGATFVLDPA
ncbi:DUF1285 domain-containing protein [Croceicoccus ponticola]|uniref:DUF1285 domain-containing protein n=1 Tax=Croceicoccus ponticola TaxID=2217664 RepID=A0A437GUX4_9SPHN|nr:DUF1285 domain-containing protein [Croceicoccus ponticola]RVQ65447.1 DUF1285 domain-containing protein [Croceicoccus ponticola]